MIIEFESCSTLSTRSPKSAIPHPSSLSLSFLLSVLSSSSLPSFLSLFFDLILLLLLFSFDELFLSFLNSSGVILIDFS